MSIPLLDLKAQYTEIREETTEAINRVIESQRFILGPEVEALESEIAEYCQCRYGIGISSGTDALLAALTAIGIRPGDEVITSSYSFFATAGSIARLGAKPVFVDINPRTFNIDVDKLEAALSEKTRAVVPVHLFGQTADMDPLVWLARKHDLSVVEDAAQAIGADYKGRRAGSIGHAGCFSFFPSKNLGAWGEGGMIVTNDSRLAERAKLLRNHGFRSAYRASLLGGNFRLDEIQAAVLRVKLKYLEEWTTRRRAVAGAYRDLFQKRGVAAQKESELELRAPERPRILLPEEAPHSRHVYHQFVIRTSRRDALRDWLESQSIGCAVYYPVPLHLQDCFSDLAYTEGDLPSSESAARQALALPIYPELEEASMRRVVEVLARFLEDSKGTGNTSEELA